STEGIRLHVRRSKAIVDLPWSDYNHLYILEGYRRRVYLFTPEPMSKDMQLVCYKACLKNKDILQLVQYVDVGTKVHILSDYSSR
ncbi:MAG: hypothetical protein IKY54_05545, partial [Muribaculaceae bacterium]|nr:hypothetical protein [Muribaculaceae bacterium]